VTTTTPNIDRFSWSVLARNSIPRIPSIPFKLNYTRLTTDILGECPPKTENSASWKMYLHLTGLPELQFFIHILKAGNPVTFYFNILGPIICTFA
jgi:hypothetical protein